MAISASGARSAAVVYQERLNLIPEVEVLAVGVRARGSNRVIRRPGALGSERGPHSAGEGE